MTGAMPMTFCYILPTRYLPFVPHCPRLHMARSQSDARWQSSTAVFRIIAELIYTQSSFKRNGHERNEDLGVRKKRSTLVLGVRNTILAGGEKK
jgi:hypothetical protein